MRRLSSENLSASPSLVTSCLKYVLISAARYSPARHTIWQITQLAFLTSILTKYLIEQSLPFCEILDTMLDVVGTDFRRCPSRRCCNSSLLFPEKKPRLIAEALNSLDSQHRLFLVFRYMNSSSDADISRLLDVSVTDVRCLSSFAESAFVQSLASLLPETYLPPDDISSYLAALDAALDLSPAASLYHSLVEYLSQNFYYPVPSGLLSRHCSIN